MISKKLTGKAWKFGEEIDTGQIIPGRYVPLTDPEELALHVFEDVAPDFRSKVQRGDMIVAGRNFGCGSSREHAPKGLRGAGITAIVADSFARIFFRNCINLGLIAISIPDISNATDEGDVIEVDLNTSTLKNMTKSQEFSFPPYDDFIQEIIAEGGIINYTWKKYQAENMKMGS
jgi:3-isopropylmalate/(R)-2-methylmalate dehydratase small subunit